MSLSSVVMTPKLLQQICRSLDLYQTPELNDKLYLHYKGFTAISHLEPYSGLRVLYLEGNALTSLAGLDAQQELRCLYVQENSLEALDSLCLLPQLFTLNASTNFLTSLSLPAGRELATVLPRLHTLSLQNNRLSALESLESLRGHPTVAVLDLQHNRIGAQQQVETADQQLDALLALLHSLPQLRVLYLLGNPLLAHVSNYRKKTLAALPQLTYLDERPVFEEERRMVAAWSRGGVEEEREEKGRMRREEKDKERRQWELFDQLVSDAASEREGKERGQLAKRTQPQWQQQQRPQQSAETSSVSEGWEEKEQLSATVEHEVTVDEGQRVGRGRLRAVHAWESDNIARKQTLEVPAKTLELEFGAKSKAAAPRQGAMLIEVIEEEMDA